MSKFAPILPRLEIECWILGVEMSSYRVSLIAMGSAVPAANPATVYLC